MHLPDAFSFYCPLKIVCGSRALNHLPVELAAVNASAPLVLADRDQVGKKMVRRVIHAFQTSGLTLGVYDRLPDRPGAELLRSLARMYHEWGCDSLVAVGSGMVADVAKCLNVVVSGTRLDVLDQADGPGDPGPLKPLMLVSTIGGDGYEATAFASDGARRWGSPRLMPTAAFIDPTMMDARKDDDLADGALISLAHALDAVFDETAGPMCRAYAHTAVDLIVNHLPPALGKHDPGKNRCAVVNGQVAAACAFSSTSADICHRLATQLKPGSDLPLGFLLAILLPHRVAQAGKIQPEAAGDLLRPMAGADIFAVTARELKIPRTMALLWELFDAVGARLNLKIPSSLVEAGLSEAHIDQALSMLGGDPFADTAARIVHAARNTAILLPD